MNSDWGRDAVGANVAVDDYRYPSLPSQNQTNWSVALGGDQEFGRSHLTLGYAHLALHESPTDIGAPLSTTPIPYTVDDARMAYRLTRGRLEITPNFDASLSRYGTAEINGAVANQDFRNVNAFSAGVALRYALSDQGAAIFTMQGIRSDFIVQQPGAASPNATSVLALGGIDYQYRRGLALPVAGRGGSPKLRLGAYPTRVAPIARAAVIWTPTGLTTVTGSLLRTLENPTQPGSSGFAYTAATVRVDHEYLRNVVLSAAVGAQRAVYLEHGTTQTGYSIGTGVTWLINRHLRLTAGYTYSVQTNASNQAGGGSVSSGYTQNLFLISLHLGV